MLLSALLLAASTSVPNQPHLGPTLLTPAPTVPVREVNPPTPAARSVWLADAAMREPRTQVLVLGTPHLSMLPADFDAAKLAPLLDRLANWQPEMVMIEGVGGAQCDYLRTFVSFYPGVADDYCPDAAGARAALQLDQAKAEAEIAALLAKPQASRPPAERRHLAALFLASGDPASARVQWLRLPEAERKAGDGLTDDMLQTIIAKGKRPNENRNVAAALAARLGHERVWPVDDHTGDRAAGPDPDAVGKAMSSLWDNRWTRFRKTESDTIIARLQQGDVLAVYRTENSVTAGHLAVASDFAAAAADPGAERNGRKYLAYWETRNLRMVANMREAMGPTPGTRVLAIVGASHKPYYERYLGVLSEVKLVDAGTVLGAAPR